MGTMKRFQWIHAAPAVFMQVDRDTRTRQIVDEYGSFPQMDLKDSIHRIAKRLGGQNVNLAIDSLEAGDISSCVQTLLVYYDKNYLANRKKMKRDVFIDLETETPLSDETTRRLIDTAESISNSATDIHG